MPGARARGIAVVGRAVAPAVLLVAVPVVAAAALLAGLAGALPATAAVALAAGIAATGYGWLAVDRSLLVSAAMLIGGVCTVAGGLTGRYAPQSMAGDVPLDAEIPLVGLFFAVGAYLLGLSRLPGAPVPVSGRLRRAADGSGLGVCAVLVSWLLLFSRIGVRGAGLTAVLLAGIGGVAAVVAAPGGRPGVRTGRGVALSIAGLAGLTVALDYHAGRGWTVAAGSVLVAGPALACLGLRTPRTDPDDGPAPARNALLAVPVVITLAVVGYHVVAHRRFDSTAVALSFAGVAVLAVRETVAVLDLRRSSGRLADVRARFRSLVAGSSDLTMALDPDLVVRWQSPAAARLFGLSDQDVVGRPFPFLVHPDDAGRVVRHLNAALAGDASGDAVPLGLRLRDGFGAWRDTEWTAARLTGDDGALVVHGRDIAERAELRDALRQAGLTDQLTGLPNRWDLRRAVSNGSSGALLVFGLDGFAGVNHVHGLDVGDAVLVEAARRLRTAVAPGDVAARVGCDTFAVLAGPPEHTGPLVDRLLGVLVAEYRLPGLTVRLGAYGGAAGTAGDLDGDEVLRRAGLALDQARRCGRPGRVEWYGPAVEAAAGRRVGIEQGLPHAVARGELDVLYQPVVDLTSLRTVGVQALPRWRHPVLGVVERAEYGPAAVRLGVLDGVAEWTLHRALHDLSGWLRDGTDLWMSVPLAGADPVRAAVEAHGVPAARLVVEVPAGDARDARAREVRALGARVLVDHADLIDPVPFELLAVGMPAPERAGPTLDLVAGFATASNAEVVVRGLTTEGERDLARAAGCRYGQGEVLCRPVPAERLEAYLDSR